MLNNIEIINCGATYNYINKKAGTQDNSAVYLSGCTDVNMYGISIMVQSGTSGIVAVNINASKRNKMSITTSCIKASLPSSGILFHYHDYYSEINPQQYINEVHLSNYKYKTIGLCNDSFALHIATNQTKFGVFIKVLDTNFHNLSNTGVLNYHGESCGGLFKSTAYFKNCSVKYNQGNSYLNLFHIVISYNMSNFDFKSRYATTGICNQKMNVIELKDCDFVNNSNMKSIVYALLQNSLSGNVLINIKDSIFVGNYDTEIIKINSHVKLLWRVTHYINLINIIISSNEHSGFGHRLISSANGFIRFIKSVIIKNNRYKTIIRLYISIIIFKGYSEFSDNSVSFILNSKRGYYILQEYSTINITKNFVHSVMKASLILNDDSKPFCHFQFNSNTDLAGDISKNMVHYHIELIDNVYLEPKNIVQVHRSTLYYEDCTWFKNAPFSFTNSSVVYSQVIKEIPKYANKSTILMTKLLSICPCDNRSYNCSQRYVGTVFPGQTLTIKLRIITTVHPFKNHLFLHFLEPRA